MTQTEIRTLSRRFMACIDHPTNPNHAPTWDMVVQAHRHMENWLDSNDVAIPIVGCSQEGIEIEWSEVWLTLHPDMTWTAICLDEDNKEPDIVRVTERELNRWFRVVARKPSRFLNAAIPPMGVERDDGTVSMRL